jgi:hypothetical protein
MRWKRLTVTLDLFALGATVPAVGEEVSQHMNAYFKGCMAAIPLKGRNAELICACAAGVLVFASLKKFSDIEGSAIAQDCYPAFNEQ